MKKIIRALREIRGQKIKTAIRGKKTNRPLITLINANFFLKNNSYNSYNSRIKKNISSANYAN